jgi:hypothetical protein
MLTIRKQQMEAFAAASLARFHEEMVCHLQHCFPEQCLALPDGSLKDLVKSGVEKAESYGLSSRYDVMRFLEMVVVHGFTFDRLDWARAILANPEVFPGEKMDRLEREEIDFLTDDETDTEEEA